MSEEITRLNVNLNAATAAALKRLAEEQGMSLTEVVRRSISVYNFITNEVSAGQKILVLREGDTADEYREVVFPDLEVGGDRG